jgi:hypothetical protein
VQVAVRALEFTYIDMDKEKIAVGLPFDIALTVAGVVPVL